LGVLGKTKRKAEAPVRHLGKLERTALANLDLTDEADGPTIRARYTELVKRCHPDANGGDRSAEDRLQRVIRAYKTLQKAKLV
jgi:DnaJ-class molecular chaperone